MKPSPATRLGLGIASLALGALLILNMKAPPAIAVARSSTTGSGTGATGTGSGSGAHTATPAPGATSSGGRTNPTATPSGGASSGTKTVTGSLIDTRYGPVQVQITVSNGKITNVTTPQLPSGGRSGMISAYVAPLLDSETMSAQSAQINLVSGATYTSDGYDQSLQAALDQAGI